MNPDFGDGYAGHGGYFQHVYKSLVQHPADRGRREYLDGELGTAPAHLAKMEPLRFRECLPAKGHYTLDDERLWHVTRMYALSRISDFLLESACPEGLVPPGFGVTGGRRIEREALTTYTGFLSGIGFTPFEDGDSFSPFHHEIFAVVTDDDATAVTVEEVVWPGMWFGNLLFSRAGVRVRAPRHLIDPAVATTSTLYFTFRRYPRRSADPSHGWGSNSQWGTSFSRFYSDAEGFHFNWDGKCDIGADPPVSPAGYRPAADEDRQLSRRRELLLHRSHVCVPLPSDSHDWYPFDGRMSITTSTWPLQDDTIVHPVWSE